MTSKLKIKDQNKFFAKKEKEKDMKMSLMFGCGITHAGGHTIGFAQCFTFKGRLFNFQGSGKPDPVLDSTLLSNLKTLCPNRDASNANVAPLDAATAFRFDNAYFSNLLRRSGLLLSDQALAVDPTTAGFVSYYGLNQYAFSNDFAESMAKLSSVGVITGQDGQVRLKCGSVN